MTGCGTCGNDYSCATCYSDAYEKVAMIGFLPYDICKVKCPPNKLRDLTNFAKECTLDCIDFCDECTDATTCDTCEDGYFVDTSLADVCTACLANCKICEAGDTCTTCATGWEDGTVPCDTCKDGNYVDADGVCTECTIDDCATCTDETNCASCDDGFYVDAGACSDCLDHCNVCTTAADCSSCADGYEDGAAPCDTCSDGYYRDAADGNCKDCGDNCEACDDGTGCDTCAPGFGLKPNGKCVCPIETFLDKDAAP